jgi:hypothetical protein
MTAPSRSRSISKEFNVERYPARGDLVALADEERAVQSEGRHGIGRSKLPARIDRLNDLETVRDPIDTAESAASSIPGSGRRGNSKDDLGLDPRLGRPASENSPRPVGKSVTVSS